MFRNVTEPYREGKEYRCPCCKYKTLHSRGAYEICPVCLWEDDGQDEHDADEVRGGPNRNLSIRDARENFARFGASCPGRVRNVRAPLADE